MSKRKPGGRMISLRPRLRVMCGRKIALGPGRVDLLEFIGQTGSLRAAAERMGLSYMRAWTLVKDTNRWFSKPVVEAVRGGKTGGGARLTEAGQQAVALYRAMEKHTETAAKRDFQVLRDLLKS